MNSDTAIIPQGQLAGGIGIIDIGSNSVRLVVYDGQARHAAVVFNEKVLCGLGRMNPQSGKLDKFAATLAVNTIHRFTLLAEQMDLTSLSAFATAAVRDAKDRSKFLERVKVRCGLDIRVLSGAEEARYAALGVVCGIPGAAGVVGDLGGGSLELVSFKGEEMGEAVSLPIGPLRLLASEGDEYRHSKKIVKTITSALDNVDWLRGVEKGTFYLVGGSWRAFAKAHMDATLYPVHVLHGYEIRARDASDFARVLSGQHSSVPLGIPGVSYRRLELLPLASLILDRVLRRIKPKRVVISAHGVREGVFYDMLDKASRELDPLISAAQGSENRRSRHPGLGEALFHWTTPLFNDEKPQKARLRWATCLTADMGWRKHPDYRAIQASDEVLYAPWPGMIHSERAMVALAVARRYEPKVRVDAEQAAQRLLSSKDKLWAETLGSALRLGHMISGCSPELLGHCQLKLGRRKLTLTVDVKYKALLGDAVDRRLGLLARILGKIPATKKITDWQSP